ncbi:MAG TPA: hypothetical protein EYP67_07725 [Methanosarcinales archaeon]|nr:hypothetical protein [Methanosarcinales archaeon]
MECHKMEATMKRPCKRVSVVLALLLISASGAPVMAAMTAMPVKEITVTGVRSIPAPPEDLPDMNFSKLRISPRNDWIEMTPGDSEEVTVTVKNIDNKTIPVEPMIISRPYSDYIFEEDWVTITPASAELNPDSEEEFTITIEIPDVAERGYYSTQVAFTEDVMPTPYPTPYQNYINTFDLDVEVWKPPVIRVQPSHVYDRVASGRKYDYEIHIENIGEEDVEIDPEIRDGGRYYGLYSTAQAFDGDAITIDAPSVVPAGGNATINMHLSVPDGAKGGYNGELDLNIDDSATIHKWDETAIYLSFEVWTQPTEYFVKTFTTETDGAITIDLISNRWGKYGMCRSTDQSDEDPSFDVNLSGPNGDAALSLTGIAIQGSVNLGGSDCVPPWESASDEIYNEGYGGHRERYTADGAAGDWELMILPHHIEAFEYMITIGDVQ